MTYEIPVEVHFFDTYLVRILRKAPQSRNVYQIEHINGESLLILVESNFVSSWDRIADRVRQECGISPESKQIISWICRHEIIDVKRRIAMAETALFVLEETVQSDYAVKEVCHEG